MTDPAASSPKPSPLDPTAPDAPRAAGRESVGVLLFVLRYGNLAVLDEARVLAVLDEALPALRIGRGDCLELAGDKLLLPGTVVSRAHATITLGGPGHLFKNTSANGSFVNGVRVAETVLGDGDLIEIGHSLLSYRRVQRTAAMEKLLAGEPPVLGLTRTLCPELAQLAFDLAKLDRGVVRKRSVLLLGETGTGKDVVAKHIHDMMPQGPYVAVNCAAVPATLFEATLFGHVRGAFTGATESRRGLFREADGGTLLLDEIGVLPDALQAKLLRVLEDGRVAPVGSEKTFDVKVRVIAGTNAHVFDASSGFREDLRARLGGFVARLPPLRRRREDLGILVAHALAKEGLSAVEIEPEAARLLFNGPLEGNIRVLQQAVTTAAMLAAPDRIEGSHLMRVLPSFGVGAPRAPEPPPARHEAAPPEAPEQPRLRAERPSREGLVALLQQWRTVRGVSDGLGVAERTVGRWMVELGVDAPGKKKR